MRGEAASAHPSAVASEAASTHSTGEATASVEAAAPATMSAALRPGWNEKEDNDDRSYHTAFHAASIAPKPLIQTSIFCKTLARHRVSGMIRAMGSTPVSDLRARGKWSAALSHHHLSLLFHPAPVHHDQRIHNPHQGDRPPGIMLVNA